MRFRCPFRSVCSLSCCVGLDHRKMIVMFTVSVVWWYDIYCWYDTDHNERYTIHWYGVICDDPWVIQSIGLYCPIGFLLCRAVSGNVIWQNELLCQVVWYYWENPRGWKKLCSAIWWFRMWYSAESGILFDCRACGILPDRVKQVPKMGMWLYVRYLPVWLW